MSLQEEAYRRKTGRESGESEQWLSVFMSVGVYFCTAGQSCWAKLSQTIFRSSAGQKGCNQAEIRPSEKWLCGGKKWKKLEVTEEMKEPESGNKKENLQEKKWKRGENSWIFLIDCTQCFEWRKLRQLIHFYPRKLLCLVLPNNTVTANKNNTVIHIKLPKNKHAYDFLMFFFFYIKQHFYSNWTQECVKNEWKCNNI